MSTKSEIAKLACVSPATVSNYFNNKGRIGTDTRKRIEAAARDLKFPLPITSEMQDNTTIKVVLVVDDVLNPHYGDILLGINNVASTVNAAVFMMLIWKDVDAFCQMLINQKVNAIFFANYQHNIKQEHIHLLENAGIEVFFSWDHFVIDINALMLNAVQYLVDLGHRRIAYLSGLSLQDPNNDRFKAYLNALKACDLPVQDELIIDGIYPYYTDAKSGYWTMKNHLAKGTPFTAVIALNDMLAIGAMHAIRERGINIPSEISVIGCDDIMISEYVSPPLTTLHISANDIGARIMYAVLQKINNEPTCPVNLQTRLIVRKSCGIAPDRVERKAEESTQQTPQLS